MTTEALSIEWTTRPKWWLRSDSHHFREPAISRTRMMILGPTLWNTVWLKKSPDINLASERPVSNLCGTKRVQRLLGLKSTPRNWTKQMKEGIKSFWELLRKLWRGQKRSNWCMRFKRGLLRRVWRNFRDTQMMWQPTASRDRHLWSNSQIQAWVSRCPFWLMFLNRARWQIRDNQVLPHRNTEW